MWCPPDPELLLLFSEILDYPGADLPKTVERCCGLLQRVQPQASRELAAFGAFVKGRPREELEELYTHTFDLQVVCYPYVGYQLFGESYKRGAFLAALKGHFKEHGFSEGRELPDHLAVVLRFLALSPEESIARPLLEEAVIPALQQMVGSFKGADHPYRQVLWALLAVLRPGEVGESEQEGGRNEK